MQSPEPEAHDKVFDNNPDRKLEFGNVGFLGEGKTGVPRVKPLGSGTRTNNKLNPLLTLSLGIEPGPQWWEGSALTTAPSLLPNLPGNSAFGLPSILSINYPSIYLEQLGQDAYQTSCFKAMKISRFVLLYALTNHIPVPFVLRYIILHKEAAMLEWASH